MQFSVVLNLHRTKFFLSLNSKTSQKKNWNSNNRTLNANAISARSYVVKTSFIARSRTPKLLQRHQSR